MRTHTGLLRLALSFATLLAALSLVVWRQSRALDLQRDLDQLRTARAIAEAERSELTRRVEYLESRARVVRAANSRLGLRVPSSHEIIILPLGERAPSAQTPLAVNTRPHRGALRP